MAFLRRHLLIGLLGAAVWALPSAAGAGEPPAAEPAPAAPGATPSPAADGAVAASSSERSLLTDVRVGIAYQDRLLASQGPAGVRRVFDRFLASNPNHPILRFLAGRAEGGRTGASEMRTALEKRLGLPPTERDQIGAGWFALARRQAELDLLDEALTSAGYALRLLPGSRTYALLGWIQARKGSLPQATAAYLEAVKADGRDLPARLALTDLLLRSGRAKEALLVARGTLLLAPRSAMGQFHWGTALALSGNGEDGRRAYQRALRLAAGDPDQVAAIAAALRRIDGQHLAYETLLRTHAVHREHRGLTLELAAYLIETGRHGTAQEILDTALKVHPKDAALWFLHGVSDDAEGDLQGAVACHGRAARLEPGQVGYRLALGAAWQRAGNGEEALRTYRGAAQRFPADRRAREMYARGLLDGGQYAEAAREFEEVARMAPYDPDPCYFLAVVTGIHLGQTEQAHVWLERYAALGGIEPAALEWLEQLRKSSSR